MLLHGLGSALCLGSHGGLVARHSGQLPDWTRASDPAGRFAHPLHAEEHLLPLHVVAGAAGDSPGARAFSDQVMEVTFSGFRFD